MNNIFVTREPIKINAPSHVKKALGNMKRTGPEFDIINKALTSLKIKFECPGVVGTTAVHFIIPKHKIAICFKTTNVSHTLRKRLALQQEGWYLSVVDTVQIMQLPPEAIKLQFAELVEAVKIKNS